MDAVNHHYEQADSHVRGYSLNPNDFHYYTELPFFVEWIIKMIGMD